MARTALVERLCSDDKELLQEAESLLAEAEVILEGGDEDLEACAEDAGTRIVRDGFSEIGRRIGAYVTVRRIGEGGMGSVYLAARADGHFEKEVAIKVLNPGTDMDEVIRRFRSEQQVLARLEHPNIARLLDAGRTDDALPYFVMEYIDGVPVTDFIEEAGLPIEARLQLFRKICSAVEFAHANSVVHRDLKPSNILVNRAGEPKLLDFGIAKLLGPEIDHLERTAPGYERLSPIAASPEQAAGAAVTKSSDVYALGALLYEMLTGTRPHRFANRRPSQEELISVLFEQEPVLPSRAVQDQSRRRQIQGDLDSIVLKALQKEPAHRYPSVRGLAEDVERYLANEPVSARTSRSINRLFAQAYRSRRFRLAGFAALVVAAGLVVLNWDRLSGIWPNLGKQTQRSSAQTNGAPSLPEKSIAVLPFDSLTGEEDVYFADGVQDNLLTDLAKVSDLRVIGRTSVASYRKVKETPREIGAALRVSYVLEGSIQKAGDRIRLNVRLIDTRTEAEIWGEYYDRTIDDLFALQSELAETIASRLKATLLPDEKAAIEKRPTQDMVAYDLYLHARVEFYRYNHSAAIEFLQSATARDPKFVLAYVLLAEMNLYQYRFITAQEPKYLTAAKEAADKALALAPTQAESHLAQAQYYYYGTQEYEAALRELKLAGFPSTEARFLDLHALVLRRLGHWKEAIRIAERAAEVDPANPFIVNELLESYLHVRRFEDAEALASKAIRLLPPTDNYRWVLKADSFLKRGLLDQARATLLEAPLARPHKVLGLVKVGIFARDYDRATEDLKALPVPKSEVPYALCLEGNIARGRGDLEQMRAVFQMAHDLTAQKLAAKPDNPGLLVALGFENAALGRKEEALRAIRRAVELVPISRDTIEGANYETHLAMIYAEVGEVDLALEVLSKIVRLPAGPSYGELRFDPGWDNLRTHPKFEEIVQQSLQPPVYD